MIIRENIKYLQEWRKREDRRPLILRGARQVGKTTIVDMFAEDFDCYIKLNLDEENDRQLFDRYKDIDNLLDAVLLQKRTTIVPGNTLIFIDKIQNSASAVAMLRYFYEKHPELYVIAAGSLLENVIDRKISIPVGRVEYTAMHPCSFIEFLEATEGEFDANVLRELKGDAIHDRLMNSFRKYCIVGGMPAAVAQYIQTKDLNGSDRIYDSLIASYSDDVEKYSPNNTITRVMNHILEVGWQKACEMVVFERFGGSQYKSREVGEAFRLIQKAMLLELVYPTTGVQLPIEPQMAKRPKLIWLDTGLVNYKSEVREEVFSVEDIADAYRGKIAEQVVAQEMIAKETKVTSRRAFWVSGNKNSTAEVDFVWKHHSHLIPLEVKTGANTHMRSLQIFMKDAPTDVAIRVWGKEFSVDDVHNSENGKTFRLINLPYYYVGMLDRVAEKYF